MPGRAARLITAAPPPQTPLCLLILLFTDVQMCGCTNSVSPGCWRYCPKLQRSLLVAQGPKSNSGNVKNINRTRRQLVQDWLLRFKFEVGTYGVVCLVSLNVTADTLVSSNRSAPVFVAVAPSCLFFCFFLSLR